MYKCQEFESRIAKNADEFPYLVAEEDQESWLGYAMLRPIMHAAYDWTTELSIYVAKRRVDKDRPPLRP